MNRLTTDKPVSKMSMVELAHNSCYTKDGVARYRDYETEIDAIELARDLMLSYRLLEENDTAAHDEDALNDELVESLAYGPKEIEGLIALFYRSILAMSDLREWLKEYEDAEEQGLLVKLPCKLGDDLYTIFEVEDNEEELEVWKYSNGIHAISIKKDGIYVTPEKDIEYQKLGADVFLTKEEAEAALKVMEKGNV